MSMKVLGIASTTILSLLLVIAAPAFALQEQRGEKPGHAEAQAGKHEQARPEAKPAQSHVQQQKQQAPRAQQPKQQANQPQHAQPQKQVEQKQRPQPQRAQQSKQQQAKQPQHAQPQKQAGQKRQQQAKAPQHAQPAKQQDQNTRPQHAQSEHANTPHPRTPAQERVQHSSWQQQRAKRWESDHRNWQQRGGYHGYHIPDARFRGYFGPEHGFRIYGLPFLVVSGHPRFRYRGYWFSPVDPWPESWANNWYDTDEVYVTYTDHGYYLFDRVHPDSGIAISISM